MELRNLLSLGSVEPQTLQSQAIMGTPPLVPVPKKVMVSGGVKFSLRKVMPIFFIRFKSR
jgi:hypothetical protein